MLKLMHNEKFPWLEDSLAKETKEAMNTMNLINFVHWATMNAEQVNTGHDADGLPQQVMTFGQSNFREVSFLLNKNGTLDCVTCNIIDRVIEL